MLLLKVGEIDDVAIHLLELILAIIGTVLVLSQTVVHIDRVVVE